MELLAIALAALVGVSLGLLGGGGSILLVPLLVYVAGVPANEAVALSLVVVGATAATAAVPHARAGRVAWSVALPFGAAGMVGAYLGGMVGSRIDGRVLLALFGVMMLVTAVAMVRGRATPAPTERHTGAMRWVLIALEGVAVGFATGVVGAGGGFLVVPALVLLGGLSMPRAVGTSLVVIAMKSTAGVAGYLSGLDLDLGLGVPVIVMAALGAVVGARLVDRVDPDRLRAAFGWAVLVMGIVIVAAELPDGLRASPVTWVVGGLVATGAAATGAVRRGRRADPNATPSTTVTSKPHATTTGVPR